MIRGIHHVAVSTPDLDRIVSFYRDVMGAIHKAEAVDRVENFASHDDGSQSD